ncbi:deaminase, partial [Streptomyces spectabilis]
MRKLIVSAFVSLDGVVEAPGGEPGYRNSGWTFKDIEFLPEAFEIKGREQQEAAAMMMGRVSYEAFS